MKKKKVIKLKTTNKGFLLTIGVDTYYLTPKELDKLDFLIWTELLEKGINENG